MHFNIIRGVPKIKKRALVILLNSLLGLIVGIPIIKIFDNIPIIFVIPFIVYPIIKVVENKFLGNDIRNPFTNMIYPCIIWVIIILAYWFFVDVPKGGCLSGLSLIFVISPILVYLLNIIFEFIVINKRKKAIKP